MAKYLVIVESPAKVNTIKKFLGANYEVMASNGHVRDLPKSQMGIDVENDYEPKYITIRGKGDILADLRKKAKKAEKVFADNAAIIGEETLALSVTSAAKRGYVDQIIEAADTRKYVIGEFEMLFTKSECRPDKKHGTV